VKKILIAVVAIFLAAAAFGAGMAVATDDSHSGSGPAKIPSQPPPKLTFPGPYSGHATKTLGTIVVPAAGAQMHWHGKITVTNATHDAHRLNVTHALTGQRFVAGGTYHHVRVHSTGGWTIKFTKRLIIR
jgi:hypothetical protein